MGTAALIRSYRVRAGKSRSDVARELGLNEAWYDDLEHGDDELASTLTLFQAIELASALGVSLHNLMGRERAPERKIALVDLPGHIEAHAARNGLSIADFEEQVGWSLCDVLASPLQAAAGSPLVVLQAVANELDIDWLSLVPDESER